MKLLEPGTTVDGFTVDECIHSGGMAHIYRVHYSHGSADPGFAMAMKVPNMGTSEGAQNTIRFEVSSLQLQNG